MRAQPAAPETNSLCDALEDLNKLGDFTPLILCISRDDRMLNAMLDVIVQNFVLDFPQGSLNGLDLVDDIDAVSVTGNHARDTANLTLYAAQPDGGRFLDGISHVPYCIYPYGVYGPAMKWPK